MKRVLILSLAVIWGLAAVVGCSDEAGILESPTAPPQIEAGEPTEATTTQTGATQSKKKCGGIAGLLCGETEYCAYDVGDRCGAMDRASVCEPRPLFCSFEYDPVCACDGRTYGNKCQAATAGFGILHKGEC